MKRLFLGALMALVVLVSCGGGGNNAKQKKSVSPYPENSPVAKYGRLQVKDLQLCDKDGNPVQLAGMSTMGWQWCGDCYTKESIKTMVEEWGINVLRLAMYVEEGGYNTNPIGFKQRMCEMIDICGELGIYCVVDWHILTPGNPLDSKYGGAKEFFSFISKKYANKEHLLYEICN